MKDFLHPYKNLDVLGRYSKVAPLLDKILKWKEIASKIIGERFVLLKRGTKNEPLYIEDFKEIDEHYLKLRADHHLDEVKEQLTQRQILLRQYFVPRKLVNFFYACNNEFWNTIDRIFIDIDRQTNSADDARKVACELMRTISSDKLFTKLVSYKTLILRTGASFHIYILLDTPVDHAFYDTYMSYGKGKEDSFPTKRARQVSEVASLNVIAGHERRKWAIILDTSNTPPGKLARCPFSLHIKDFRTIDGITIPITEKELADPKLISRLQKLTPEKIRKNIERYTERLT